MREMIDACLKSKGKISVNDNWTPKVVIMDKTLAQSTREPGSIPSVTHPSWSTQPSFARWRCRMRFILMNKHLAWLPSVKFDYCQCECNKQRLLLL